MTFPTPVNTPTVGFAFTGGNGLFSKPILPLAVTRPVPAEAIVGDLLLAFVTVNGKFPGVGAHVNPIDVPAGWTLYTTQYGNVQDGLNILTRVVDGTEGPTVKFNYSGPAFNFSGFSLNATILVIRNGNPLLDAFQFGLLLSSLGALTANGTITKQLNTLVLVLMQPKSDAGQFSEFPENDLFITPADPPGLTPVVKAKQFQPNGGNLADSLAIWSVDQPAIGPTGNFISPTGWPEANAFANQLVVSIGFIAGPPAPPPPPPPRMRVAGELIGLTYDPPEVEDGQNVTAWHRHPLGASKAGDAHVLSITTIPAPDGTRDELWLLAQRVINGRKVVYHEYMEKAFETGDAQASQCFMDSSVQYSGPPVTTVFPLDHLEGETVRVLVDGAAHPDCVVVNGQITLNAPASVVQVGLKTAYDLVTLRVEAGSQLGTAQAKLKRISKLNGIRLLNSLGGKFGQYGGPWDELEYRDTADNMDEPPALFTGDMTNLSYQGDWERSGRIQITDDGPFAMCVVALFPELETTD